LLYFCFHYYVTRLEMQHCVYYLLESTFKFVVSKASDDVIVSLFFQYDIRKFHPVKGIVFYHRIDYHILKFQPFPWCDRMVKRIITDHISRKTGRAGKTE